LHEPVIPFIIRWKHTLCELGTPPVTQPNISASLSDAIKKDADVLRWCVSGTVEQHRQLREAVRPILVLGPDAPDTVKEKARAFLQTKEVLRLREVILDTVGIFSVG